VISRGSGGSRRKGCVDGKNRWLVGGYKLGNGKKVKWVVVKVSLSAGKGHANVWGALGWRAAEIFFGGGVKRMARWQLNGDITPAGKGAQKKGEKKKLLRVQREGVVRTSRSKETKTPE